MVLIFPKWHTAGSRSLLHTVVQFGCNLGADILQQCGNCVLNGLPLRLPSGEGVFKDLRDIPQYLMNIPQIAGWLAGNSILFSALNWIPLKYYWSGCSPGAIERNVIGVTSSSINSAASACMKGSRWPHKSRVVLALGCPKRRITTMDAIPLLSIKLADVCLRSWNLIFGKPAAFITSWKTLSKWHPQIGPLLALFMMISIPSSIDCCKQSS